MPACRNNINMRFIRAVPTAVSLNIVLVLMFIGTIIHNNTLHLKIPLYRYSVTSPKQHSLERCNIILLLKGCCSGDVKLTVKSCCEKIILFLKKCYCSREGRLYCLLTFCNVWLSPFIYIMYCDYLSVKFGGRVVIGFGGKVM